MTDSMTVTHPNVIAKPKRNPNHNTDRNPNWRPVDEKEDTRAAKDRPLNRTPQWVNASTSIQSVYRGHRLRQKLRKWALSQGLGEGVGHWHGSTSRTRSAEETNESTLIGLTLTLTLTLFIGVEFPLRRRARYGGQDLHFRLEDQL